MLKLLGALKPRLGRLEQPQVAKLLFGLALSGVPVLDPILAALAARSVSEPQGLAEAVQVAWALHVLGLERPLGP